MKTNIYILLIVLLSVSFANAQSTTELLKVETNNTVLVSNDDKELKVENVTVSENKEEETLIKASDLNETIARSTSDIRSYFNRMKNVDNLSLLFPEMNKERKA